jgi:hypothetical protein
MLTKVDAKGRLRTPLRTAVERLRQASSRDSFVRINAKVACDGQRAENIARPSVRQPFLSRDRHDGMSAPFVVEEGVGLL